MTTPTITPSATLAASTAFPSTQSLPTTLKAAQAEILRLTKLAYCCRLTGLPNRLACEERLIGLMSAGIQFCLFSIDLNKFKPVNDKAGHEAGDYALKAISRNLRTVGGIDSAYRWGGDEFIAIATCAPEDAPNIVNRLKGAISAANLDESLPVIMKGHRCGAAIGWASSGTGCDGSDNSVVSIDGLMKKADAAMYADKTTSR